MRRGATSKSVLWLVCLACFFSVACAQQQQQATEKDTLKQIDVIGAKAYELRQQGDLRGAIEEQSKIIKLKSDDWESLTVLAGMYLDLYDDHGKSKADLVKAKELLQEAIRINPNDITSKDMLAGALDRLGDKSGKLKHSKEVIKLLPDDLESLTNLGAAQNGVGDNKAARETFEQVLQKNPNYAYALYIFAELELEEGNRAKAIELFERGSKASTADNGNATKYIELCRRRLAELKNEKAKAVNHNQ